MDEENDGEEKRKHNKLREIIRKYEEGEIKGEKLEEDLTGLGDLEEIFKSDWGHDSLHELVWVMKKKDKVLTEFEWEILNRWFKEQCRPMSGILCTRGSREVKLEGVRYRIEAVVTCPEGQNLYEYPIEIFLVKLSNEE